MPLLHTALIVLLLQAGLVLYGVVQRRHQKVHQDALADDARGTRFWRVAFSDPPHLRRLWKLNAVRGLGLRVDDGDRVRLRGRWSRGGEPSDVSVAKHAARPAWGDDPTLRSGNLSWVRLQTPIGELAIAADTGFNAIASREALADIVRSVFPALPLAERARAEFALEKNARSLAAVLAFEALVLFASIDTFVIARFELIDAQIVALLRDGVVLTAASAVLAATGWIVHRLLRAGGVPARESLALSGLVTCAIAIAALPVAKRVDQALAGGASADYRYRVADTVVHLDPVDRDRGLPRLRFTRAPEYWAQFAPGSEVAIPLLRGPLGLWQLDHERFDPPVFAFYERRPAK